MFLDHWSLICSRHKEETLTFLTVYGAAPNPLSSCVYPSAGGPEWRVAMRCETSLLAWVCLIVSSLKMPAAHWLFSTTPRD